MNRIFTVWGTVLLLLIYALFTVPKALTLTSSPFALAQYLVLTWFAPATFIVLINKRSWAAYLIVFIYIMSPEVSFGGRLLPAFFLFLWPVFLLLVGQAAINRKPLIPRYMVNPFLLGYALVAIIAYAKTPVFTTIGTGNASGFRAYFIFFSTLLLYPLMPGMLNDNQLRRLPVYFFTASLIVIGIKTVAFFFGNRFLNILLGVRPEEWLVEGRLTFLAHAGGFLVLASLAMSFEPGLRIKSRIGLYALTAIGLATLAMTGTRSSVLAAGGVILLTSAMKRAWWFIGALLGGLFLVFLVVSNMDINPANPLAPFLRSFTLPWLNLGGTSTNLYATWETFDWRKGMWELSLKKIHEKPLLGHGFFAEFSDLMAFYSMFGHRFIYYELTWLSEIGSGATHNLWLGPFVNFGMIGGFLFIFYAIHRSVKVVIMSRSVRPENPYNTVVVFMSLWLCYILGGSYTTGGTNATYFYLFAAISHLLEYKISVHKKTVQAGQTRGQP